MKTLPNDIFFAEVEQLLAAGERVMITVQGNSMRPFMRSGRTRVTLALCEPAELRRGDVVLFRYRGRHILHRIVRAVDGEFVMAGDGNYKVFERCTAGDIVAKVESVVNRRGGVVECRSRSWRWRSRCWLALPQFVRRCILWFLRHVGLG